MLIQKILKEKMPEIEAAMVITNEGELLDYDVTKTFLNENDFKSTGFLTNLVSLRFRIGEFAKQYFGLDKYPRQSPDEKRIILKIKPEKVFHMKPPS